MASPPTAPLPLCQGHPWPVSTRTICASSAWFFPSGPIRQTDKRRDKIMKTLSVVTAFFAIAIHATGAYALAGYNGPSANGMSAAMPVAGVDANDMQVFSVVL